MATFTVIPAIDVLEGRCVRLSQGRREHVTIEGGDPGAAAARFAAEGAKWLHVVDLDGAFSGRPTPGLLERLAGVGVPLQIGGGLRDAEAVDAALATPKLITKEIRADAEACSKSDAIRELASLPPGLISAHIDIGAYIAALTPHRVLSAPYHRIPDAILANHTLLASRSDAVARATIAREGVDYVVTCRGLDDPFVSNEAWKGSLRANLVANQAPAYLTPVTLANRDSIIRVWRVDRDKLNPQP